MSRNGYMLKGSLQKTGYDWWWHSLVGVHHETGEKRSFFIEYYIVNPALGGEKPIFGQVDMKTRPSYAMIKCGSWGENDSVQIHNFYGTDSFTANKKEMHVVIGDNVASETLLIGKAFLSKKDVKEHPEYFSDAGDMCWNLKAEKLLDFNVGYGASALFRRLNAFQMFWHAEGQYTAFSGYITFNGEKYNVSPDIPGYQDKNWGRDYTPEWIWLNCNNFKSIDGEKMPLTSLNVGGAQPIAFGISLPRKLLLCFYYHGKKYEFNFSKFWQGPRQTFDCREEDDRFVWDIQAWNRKAKLDIHFSCPKKQMLCPFKYESPEGGPIKHQNLWNSGTASGTVKFYLKKKLKFQLIDKLEGCDAGCEYGKYSR